MFNVTGAVGSSKETLMINLLKTAFIIDFGFIIKKINEDFVTVQVGACAKESGITAFTCVMGSFASSNMTVKVEPKEGDRVIVLYPRAFHYGMFDHATAETKVDENVEGYAFGKGIAFLANQFFTEPTQKNFLYVHDDSIEGTITNHPLSLKINNSDDEEVASLSVEATGKMTYAIKDKLEFTLGEDGNISVNAKDGKFNFTNSKGKSLGNILSKLCDDIKTHCDNTKSATTVGSPATHTMNPASQALFQQDGVNIGTTDKTDLSNLLEA